MPTYQLPDLSYEPSALEPHISGQIMELHHDKHHAAYVKGANTTLEKLEAARNDGDFGTINQLEKDLAFHLSGHALHSLFWTNMAPDRGGKPEGELAAAIDESFGSFEGFQGQLTAATTGVQGSGWGALSWDDLGERLIVEQIFDHQGNHAQSTTPLLVIDMWEHAFYLQYLNDKAAWVEAFWNIADWESTAARFADLRS
jgi:Fe-Mn family superoxide dismutase